MVAISVHPSDGLQSLGYLTGGRCPKHDGAVHLIPIHLSTGGKIEVVEGNLLPPETAVAPCGCRDRFIAKET